MTNAVGIGQKLTKETKTNIFVNNLVDNSTNLIIVSNTYSSSVKLPLSY